MMIVMKATATEDEIQAVMTRIESCGARAHPSRGEEVTVIGAIGDREHVARLGLEGAPGVEKVVPILKPYKLASKQLKGDERTVIEIDGRRIGGDHFALIAGPCTVESREQTLSTARTVSDAGPRCSAAAPTSRAPPPTRFKASAPRDCDCSPKPRPRPACRS
jgi:3-deoxy-7-phosphoheptulonate synthase